MTILSETQSIGYTGDGSQTTFAYPFKVFDKTHLKVYVDGALRVVDTDYSVTGVGSDAGGNVVFSVAPANGAEIYIKRVVPLTQETDYVENDPFPAESHENTLDKLVMIDQQQQEEIDRSLKLSESIDETLQPLDKTASQRAGKALVFDPNGDPNVSAVGVTGIQGDKGGIRYVFSTITTDSDPGQGKFRYNNTAIASVTYIYINVNDELGNDISAYIDSWDDSTNPVKGYLEIKSNDNADATVNIWRVDGLVTATGYRKITVTYVSGSLPSDGEACVISFSRAGDQGPGDVISPATNTDNFIPQWNGANSKTLKDGFSKSDLLSALQEVVTYGATITLDFSTSATKIITLAGNPTITFSNPTNGQVYRIVLIQDATGSRTVTWGSTIKWAGGSAPTLTTTADKADIITILYAGGTYYADISNNF